MNEAIRRTLYTSHGVKMLLRYMQKQEHELVPEYDQNVGFRYPQAEQFIVGPVTETLYLIRKLYEAGVLLKKYRDKAVACPSCLSPAVSVRYLCTSCSSSNLEKHRTWRHLKCGFADSEELFMKDGESICPKCGKLIEKSDLEEAGTTFRCRTCGESFEKPTWMHNCKKCKFNFTLNEASFIDVYSYVLSEETRQELELGEMSIAPVSSVFEKSGLEVSTPGYLKGKSGATHTFDILGRSVFGAKEKIVVLDLAYASDSVDVSPVSTLMGKLVDTEAGHGILVAIPMLDPTAKNLAELYDIEIVEARTPKDAAGDIEKSLRRLLQA
jgi:DNA-directed RNA polymerase subunit RPC12/RpoP